MNIAITVWNNRISPVFDSAQELLVAKTQGTEIVDAVIRESKTTFFNQFIDLLKELDVHVLICGALCEGPASMLDSHGVEVISFITGEVENVLECYLQGEDMTRFLMPGCRQGGCCRTREGEESRKKVNKL
jgi:predicted Fe-Mo cluster-binding NifX family protein